MHGGASMSEATAKTSRASVIYEWQVADAADIEHHENSKRLTVRPSKVEIHAGGYHKPGELTIYVYGRRVRQADGELGGLKSAAFGDDPHFDHAAISEAPKWVRELVDSVRAWEAVRA